MINAAVEANATKVGKTFHKFEPLGVTGIIAIAESHFCIHTWPEHSYAAADIFTCGSKFKPFQSVQLLIKSLQCSDPHIKEIKRGAMPMIKEKFHTYHDFAFSSLNEIYSSELLSSADRYEVTELASGLLENRTDSNGNIELVFRPLPRIVQSSPIFGSVLCDVNGDGNLDLYVVQNFSGPQRETGYMHGGVSQLLLADGSGGFEPISQDRS